MRTIVISTILIATFSTLGFSQSDEENRKTVWTKFTSKSSSFTVNLPETPTEELSVETGDELKFYKCAKSISYYRLPGLYDVKKVRFVLREVDVTGCKRSTEDFATDFRGFFQSLTGPTPQVHYDRVLDFGQFEGVRDVLYESGAYYPGTKDSAIYNKIRAIDAGNRIFILTYFRGEGTVGEEYEIFNSFRPKYEKCEHSVSQTRAGWITFTPNSKSFSIDLPEQPAIKLVGGENGATVEELKLFNGAKFITHYELPSIFRANKVRLLIREIDVGSTKTDEKSLEASLNAFLDTLIGDTSNLHSKRWVELGGLRFQDILYHSGGYYLAKSKIYNRLLAGVVSS